MQSFLASPAEFFGHDTLSSTRPPKKSSGQTQPCGGGCVCQKEGWAAASPPALAGRRAKTSRMDSVLGRFAGASQPGQKDLLVPSSVTIPRPSALFCLSKALRSSTLQMKGRNGTREEVRK